MEADLGILGVSWPDGRHPVPSGTTRRMIVRVKNHTHKPVDAIIATNGRDRDGGVQRTSTLHFEANELKEVELAISIWKKEALQRIFSSQVWLARADSAIGAPLRDGVMENNSYSFNYPLAPYAWNVTATIRRIDVHDDCDNVSPGDIQLHYTVNTSTASRSGAWPSNTRSTNVSSGESKTINRYLRLRVNPDQAINIAVLAVDCDSSGALTLGLEEANEAFRGSLGLAACTGEELLESSGSDDSLGQAAFLLDPQDWQRGAELSRRASGGDCNGAFTAHIGVTATPIW